jgi:cytochrome c biogenesis protein CcmG/thiol:disulfide interchange protein DsbE
MSRWLAALPLLAIAAMAALFSLYALHRDPHVEPRALVGKPMPDVTLASLDDGRPVRLRDALLHGPVVVNFYASWCGPCELDQPALLAMKAKGVRVLGVAYEDVPPRGSADKARAFLARLGDPFATRLIDPDGRAGIEFGITGVPETFLVGADGKILDKRTGPLGREAADRLAAGALTGR